jgi:hypothetical protein
MVARDLHAIPQQTRPAPARYGNGGWFVAPVITAGFVPVLLGTAVVIAACWLRLLAIPGFEAMVAQAAAVHTDTSPSFATPPTGLSSVFTPEVQRWAPEIVRWAAVAGVSPDLAATVMQIESCGAASVRSPAGAAGLFQVMPFHFAAGEDSLDAETNARRGLAYLARAYNLSEGQVDRTLAGYNGGHGVIYRDPSTWSGETQRYVYWGTGILEDIQAGLTASPRLEEWLQSGGASLCRRAAANGPG